MTRALPQGSEKAVAVRSMFDAIAPRYEMVNRLISLGLDNRWRKLALSELRLPAGSRVVDIAAGTGDFCRLLQKAAMVPIGLDFSYGMLASARTSASLIQADALRMPFVDAGLDGATCGFALRNFVDLPLFFAELARTVRPGGRVALLDAARPTNKLARTGHAFYFGQLVPRIGAAFSDGSAYRYLPDSLAYLPERPKLLAMVGAAGFKDVRHVDLTLGAAQLITATKT